MNRGRGYGLKQKGTGKMATKDQRAKNIRSGRLRGLNRCNSSPNGNTYGGQVRG